MALEQPHALAQDQQTPVYSYNSNTQHNWSQKTGDMGYWIIDTSNPGTDIPNVGRSLFDMIMADGLSDTPNSHVPFPFSKLIEKIRSHMQPSNESIKQVRIPIGRSLRREISAPDYFHSPRIIIAADSQPALTKGQAGLNLRGRLFLGYQEKSRILEIISYNPWAGRFEFQEVRNYGPGLEPEIAYANRTLCLSCHQNSGPIFAREPWLETDSNQQIKQRLPNQTATSKIKAQYLPRFDNVWALDYATDRANYFASSQFIWQQACNSTQGFDILKSVQCRAAMFTAILQYHLLDYVDQNSTQFRKWFLPLVADNWKKNWPNGLLIATADITDKNPFTISTIPTQDPLNPRPPRAKWTKPSPHLLTGIIYQTADFITDTDIFQIDQFLRQQAKTNNLPTKRYETNCSLTRTADIGSQKHLKFSCKHMGNSNKPIFSTTGAFIVDGQQILDGNINTLEIPSLSANLRFLDLANTRINTDGALNRVSIPMNKYEANIGARLFNGTLIRQIDFQWPTTLEEFSTVSNQPASLVTVNDIAPLYTAIDKMIADNITGKSDALTSKPFRRHSLIKSLHENIGMPALTWHQDKINESISNQNEPSRFNQSNDFAPFYKHCASCHLTQGNFPPGFLSGSAKDVKQQIRQCAQKIILRLNLWNNKAKDRHISPMPPSSWLSIAGISEEQWLQSSDLRQMQQLTEDLLLNYDPLPVQLSRQGSLCL